MEIIRGNVRADHIHVSQVLLMEKYFRSEFLIENGWRISFLIGGLIGIFGYFLRKKLHESAPFLHLKEKHAILKNPIKHSLKNYKTKILIGFFISIFEVVGFFLLTFFLVENAEKILKLTLIQNLIMNIFVLTITMLLLPIIGKIGEYYNNKSLLIWSTLGIIIFSLAFYFTTLKSLTILPFIFLGIVMLLLCVQYALLPSLIANLFPTSIRFTCIGMSFNICDSFIGGISTYLSFIIVKFTGHWASFILLLPIAGLIFLVTLPFAKEKKLI